MTQEANHDSRPEKGEAFPACRKDLAEKMAGCGPMMEKMMTRFGAKASKGACGGSDERR